MKHSQVPAVLALAGLGAAIAPAALGAGQPSANAAKTSVTVTGKKKHH